MREEVRVVGFPDEHRYRRSPVVNHLHESRNVPVGNRNDRRVFSAFGDEFVIPVVRDVQISDSLVRVDHRASVSGVFSDYLRRDPDGIACELEQSFLLRNVELRLEHLSVARERLYDVPDVELRIAYEPVSLLGQLHPFGHYGERRVVAVVNVLYREVRGVPYEFLSKKLVSSPGEEERPYERVQLSVRNHRSIS